MKKFFIILLSIALVGSLGFIGYQEHTKKEKQEELARNRKYEISLVKALKNSYQDIKEIKIENPRYNSQKPGPSWHCSPTITFSDGFIIKYYISHSLDQETNRSAQIGGAGEKSEEKVRQLKNRYGDTKDIVTIYYSNGEKGEQ